MAILPVTVKCRALLWQQKNNNNNKKRIGYTSRANLAHLAKIWTSPRPKPFPQITTDSAYLCAMYVGGGGDKNVYFSSAERSDRDNKCFIVHHTSCACCNLIQENVVLYSRLVWPLASRLQAAFPPTHPSRDGLQLLIFLSFFLLLGGGRIVFRDRRWVFGLRACFPPAVGRPAG